MSKAMKCLWVQTMIWTVIAMVMLIVFSMSSTIDQWGDHAVKKVILAIFLLIGFGTDIVTRFVMGSQNNGSNFDERDILIQHQSLSIAFVFMMLYIFILAITLHSFYETAGVVPVGWVWFIAYSSIVMANLIMGYSSIYYYRKQGM